MYWESVLFVRLCAPHFGTLLGLFGHMCGGSLGETLEKFGSNAQRALRGKMGNILNCVECFRTIKSTCLRISGCF